MYGVEPLLWPSRQALQDVATGGVQVFHDSYSGRVRWSWKMGPRYHSLPGPLMRDLLRRRLISVEATLESYAKVRLSRAGRAVLDSGRLSS